MFRRRRSRGDDIDDVADVSDVSDESFDDDDVDDEDDAADDSASDDGGVGTSGAPGATATAGPWDVADAPEDEVTRLDLGALLVPAPEGIEVRVDMQDNMVVAVTLVDGNSALQVHAFAAPRSAGIWDEVRSEISESVRGDGGSAEDVEGPFGAELRARVRAAPPEGSPSFAPAPTQPLRFIGVDGPRWFLRGLLSGAAATDPQQGRRLIDAFRDTIVVRGGDAMAPRDMLPLRLPKEAMAQMPVEAEPARPGLEILERGPEITETR